ncbi:MAG: DUF4215 domain-containing protein, partial [Kofleriaceae bacterium]
MRGERWAAALTVGALAACLAAGEVPCDDGTVCPAGAVCLTAGGCATPAQLAACDGVGDGLACEVLGAAGVCLDGACVIAVCGDGRADPGEACDDGNTLDGDGCSRYCDSDERCGNGVRDAAEECDDGNDVAHDGCQPSCRIQRCGDGVVDPDGLDPLDPADDEVCDDGNQAGGDGCTPDCRSLEVCGNGVIDLLAGEQCDEGDLRNHDGCSASCRLEAPEWSPRAQTPPARVNAAM